ncbi:flagellar hook-associated family protein [Methylobacterium brachiatum]|uniref:flagellar hook-associated family protein n=1 Tax=Methylobacterium brachiatum TaxID=269660 RepID=UPI002446EE64|nr:flagellar hook-associated family protein [Methylobacterium brachiatum]MDH2312895.1 flagellar hook-associated family protein [Methylobacterium brachiatum]
MKASFISTATLLNSARSTAARTQSDLAKANIELNKGRYADVGLELGYKTATTLDLRQQVDDIVDQQKRNDLTKVRLGDSQTALNQIRSDGEAFLALIAPGKLTDASGSVVAQAAASKLTAFIGQMNSSTAGQFLFSGINSAQRPIADYEASPQSAAKTAFTQAFQTVFGFPPGTQPGSGQITPTQMQNFLDGPVATLFADPQWGSTWSSASNTNVRNEIGPGENPETSTNANAQAFRQLAMIYTIGSSVGLSSLAPATQSVVYEKMRSVAGLATIGVTQIHADLGAVEARLTTLGKQMDARKIILTDGFASLEKVDVAEAKSRVDNLTTLLQISYSLTSQTRKLSLIDYV